MMSRGSGGEEEIDDRRTIRSTVPTPTLSFLYPQFIAAMSSPPSSTIPFYLFSQSVNQYVKMVSLLLMAGIAAYVVLGMR